MSHQVGSNAGIVGMTKEHLGLALALNVPVFVVVTKIDMCPANILQGMETYIVLIDVLLHEEKAETRMLDLDFIQSESTVSAGRDERGEAHSNS